MSKDISDFKEQIDESNSIAIISHVAPDADAFSSAMALREIIKKFHTTTKDGKRQRKRVDVFLDTEEIPKQLQVFFKNKNEQPKFLNPEKPLKNYSMAVAVDCGSKERMGKYAELFDNAKKTINIDHHATNTKFAELNFVAKASSTCEALYYMFLYRNNNIEASKYIYSLLYSGIITDTNNLKNNADAKSTEKAVMQIKQNLGSKLAKQIRSNFFENNSAARDLLNSYAYNIKNRKYFNDGKLCVIVLKKSAFAAAGADINDAEGIVDEGLYRKGVLVSALFLEPTKDDIFVKIRGKEGVDVSVLAKQFGGGGHTGQAAFQHKGKLAPLLQKFIPEARAYIENKQEEVVEGLSEIFM